MASICDSLLEGVFPARCQSCDEITGGPCFCDFCEHQIKKLKLDSSESGNALYSYRGALRKVLLKAKFAPNESAARRLIDFVMNDHETFQYLEKAASQVDGLTYVPAHWKRIWTRRFDLPFLLAYRFSKATNKPLFTFLQSRKYTSPTTISHSKEERAIAIKERFSFDPSIQMRSNVSRILLIDDIVTTGLTLEHCSTLVKEAGFFVDTLVLAKT